MMVSFEIIQKIKSLTQKKIRGKIKSLIFGTSLVNSVWFIHLKMKIFFTKKIRVGFGPVTTGENDLSERKWRIDPIVNKINKVSCDYSAGIFVDPKEMQKFDILIIIKKFNPSFLPIINELKKRNKRFIYDIVDNPNSEEKYKFYFADYPNFSNLMDGFILSSPLHQPIVEPYSKHAALIEHPIIHSEFKRDYTNGSSIRLLAHGHYANLVNHKFIVPLLPLISKEIGMKVCLIYHTEQIVAETEFVKYVKWTPENCFKEMIKADIAISIKDLSNVHQKTKPSTKVISFMAAGLPVICTPTEADRLIIRPGITGFFAYSLEDWKTHIIRLAKDVKLRKQVGNAARVHVKKNFSVEIIVEKYLSLLNEVMHGLSSNS